MTVSARVFAQRGVGFGARMRAFRGLIPIIEEEILETFHEGVGQDVLLRPLGVLPPKTEIFFPDKSSGPLYERPPVHVVGAVPPKGKVISSRKDKK